MSTSRLFERRAYGGKIAHEKRMRSEPSPIRSRTRGQRTATGPMPVTISRSGRCPWRTSRWRPSSVSWSAWRLSKAATSASTACESSARAPLRKTSVSGSENVPRWESRKTLLSVTAYHSFGGEVGASNTTTIRRLTPSCRHQLSPIAPRRRFPTDAKLMNRAREKLVNLAEKCGVKLRQSYKRVGKIALIRHQRYAHARQFGRARKALRKLKTYLGRVIRDIARKIEGNPALEGKFARLLALARRVRDQERRQRGPKVYSLHHAEDECIVKGKPHRPYEFGVKVSVATTLKHSKGGQFVIHAQALPGNPYDGHTLAVMPAI